MTGKLTPRDVATQLGIPLVPDDDPLYKNAWNIGAEQPYRHPKTGSQSAASSSALDVPALAKSLGLTPEEVKAAIQSVEERLGVTLTADTQMLGATILNEHDLLKMLGLVSGR